MAFSVSFSCTGSRTGRVLLKKRKVRAEATSLFVVYVPYILPLAYFSLVFAFI